MNRRSAEESKKKILSAALRVFSNYGYRGDCMRLIAKQAGMSVGGVYLYFKSKEDLCITMMKERMDDLSGELDRAIDMYRPEDAIASYIRVQLEYAKRHKELILTYGKDQGFSFGVDLKREFAKKQRNMIHKIISKGIETRVFAKCNIEEAARIIIGIIRGFVLSIVVDPENLFTIDECNKFVIAGLKNNGKQQEPRFRH
jgi:AcrR family transcriptional regulator